MTWHKINFVLDQIFSINNYFATPYVLLHFISGLLIILLSFALLKRENFSKASLMFSFVSLSVVLWLWGDVAVMSSKEESIAFLLAKIQTVGTVFILPSSYMFVLTIVHKFKYYKFFTIFSLTLSSIFTIFILNTDLFVTGVYHYSWGYYAKFNSFLSLLFIAFFALYVFAIIILFWNKYINVRDREEKKRFKFFLTIYCIAALGTIDLLPTFGINIFPFGAILILFALIGLFILVRRYDLMDISKEFAPQQIIETMNDILLLLNKDGIIQSVNPAALAFFGKKDADIIGMHVLQIITDTNFSNNFNRIKKTGFINDYEVHCSKTGQDKRSLSLSILSIRNALRQTLAIVLIGKDKTEYKKSEDELKKAYAVPKTIFEGMSAGIVVFDKENKIRQVNKTALELLGFGSEREVLGKQYSIKTLGTEKGASRINAIADTRAKEETIINSQGKNIAVLKTTLPITIDEEILFLDIFVDISERKELEQKLNEYKVYLEKLVNERSDELKQANAQLSQEGGERKKMEEDLRFYIDDLEKFQKITTDRKNKMTELMQEANKLSQELGRPDIYKF